jgi:RNA polymerase sigma-70 factor, ECF subfamily
MPSTLHGTYDPNNAAADEKNERFMQLLKPCHDRLARFVRAMVNSPEDAEDIVSDTILLAYEKFDTIREPQAFLSWLFTVASRLHKRRRWRASIFEPFERFIHTNDDAESHEWEPPAQGASATDSPETFVDVNLLYAALERLPHKQREAFVMFEITGLSLVEIQEVQGDSLSSVKMRLSRARERLRDLLGDESPPERKESSTKPIKSTTAIIHQLATAPQALPQAASAKASTDTTQDRTSLFRL